MQTKNVTSFGQDLIVNEKLKKLLNGNGRGTTVSPISETYEDAAPFVSVGYFLADLAMILWMYPTLGGIEYIVHHSLSAIAVAYAMFTGEGQLYTFMVLISEITTPEINMRWYLDTAGLKRSSAYLINGVVIFFAWLVIKMHIIGFLLVFVVPSALATMNLIWFGKIIKGLKKTFAKRQ